MVSHNLLQRSQTFDRLLLAASLGLVLVLVSWWHCQTSRRDTYDAVESPLLGKGSVQIAAQTAVQKVAQTAQTSHTVVIARPSCLTDRLGSLLWLGRVAAGGLALYGVSRVLYRYYRHRAQRPFDGCVPEASQNLEMPTYRKGGEQISLWVGVETAKLQREQEMIALQRRLMQCSLTARSPDEMMAATLACLCQRLPWVYGQAWFVGAEAEDNDGHFERRLSILRTIEYSQPDWQGKPIALTPADQNIQLDSTSAIYSVMQTGYSCYLPSLDGLDERMFHPGRRAIASGLDACAIVPFGGHPTQVVCLLFAPGDRPEVADAVPLLDELAPQVDLLLRVCRRSLAAMLMDDPARPAIDNRVEGLFRLDLQGCYIDANLALAQMLGYETPSELVSARLSLNTQFVTETRCDKLMRLLQGGSTINGFMAELYRRDGTTMWIEITLGAVLDETGQIGGYDGSMLDITEQRRTEDKLRYAATHDDLTGLWSRSWFVDQLQRILKRAQRYDRYRFAVLFIDLDNFKLINDTLGHGVGDQLLVALAQRFNSILQQGQSLARLGGDEFTLCVDRIADPSEAIAIAQTLCQQLQIPFQIGAHRLTAQASIGIVIGSCQYERPEMVLKDADIAMYHAKAQGKVGGVDGSRYVLFDLEMGRASRRRLRLEDDLRRAIEYGELSLYYQPIVELASMKTAGFEALLRWQHPYYGAISPAEFIPLAEESGAIVKLGEWVLQQACQQLQTWKQQGLAAGTLAIGVNVSSRQLSAGLVEQIDRALHTFQLRPGELKVEVTETAVMSDLNQARRVLEQIRERKVPILLDDFGTGYCSLNYLYELPIDTLKVDRSFVRTIDECPNRRQVLDTIFQLAKSLELRVIAEGLETAEQLAYLQWQRCCYGQGYLFSKPVPASVAQTLLSRTWSPLTP